MGIGEFGVIGVHVLHPVGKEEYLGLGHVIIHSPKIVDQAVIGMVLL